MRDLEFALAFERLTPKLHKLFSNGIQFCNGDKAQLADDLVQQTVEPALRNSRLPQHAHQSVEWLIMQKAYNVLFEHLRSVKKKVPHLRLEAAVKSCSDQNPYKTLVNRELLDTIHEKIDRITWLICYLIYEGYEYKEIAGILDISEGTIKMCMYRLRATLK